MPPEINQDDLELDDSQIDPTESMSDDDIAASLGFATTLSEPLLPQDEMDTQEDEELETADEAPQTAMEAEEESVGEVSEEKPDEIEEEVADIRKELEELKASIEDDQETKTTEDTETAE